MEKNVKDLEKMLDLDSSEQVTFKFPQQIGEGTSAAAAAPLNQTPSSSTIGTTKGKEPIDTEQVITELPATSVEQSQEQAPPQLTEAPQMPILQTLADEDRRRKHDREDSTHTNGSTQQLESKRQKVDSPFKEEISEEIPESPRRDREGSQPTPTSSFQKELDRHQAMRCPPPHNEARCQPVLKPASKRSRLKMSY